MLVAHSRVVNSLDANGTQRSVTQLVQHSEATTLQGVNGDTNKLRQAANKVSAKAMHFYKVIWQYLWLHKPEDLFNGENAFIVDAHYFFPQLIDTLTYLPHV